MHLSCAEASGDVGLLGGVEAADDGSTSEGFSSDVQLSQPSRSFSKAVLAGVSSVAALLGLAALHHATPARHNLVSLPGFMSKASVVDLLHSSFSSDLLHDPDGRCAQAPMRVGAHVTLGECAQTEGQDFSVDAHHVVRLVEASEEMCMTLSTYKTKHGTPLVMDVCRPGYHLQRIVGLCLSKGDTDDVGSWAFAKPCESLKDTLVPIPEAGTSLFCFMPVNINDSGEKALKDNAWTYTAGIFACDESRVYKAEGDFNADVGVFRKVWQDVFHDQLYLTHDWTVKVDPDVVFIATRLRGRLWELGTTIREAVYVKQSGLGDGVLGPIEVLSQLAAIHLADRSEKECAELDDAREEGWLSACLNNTAVSHRTDNKFSKGDGDADDCWDETFVGFHGFHDVTSWEKCRSRMLE